MVSTISLKPVNVFARRDSGQGAHTEASRREVLSQPSELATVAAQRW
jgi:hypothetical protein